MNFDKLFKDGKHGKAEYKGKSLIRYDALCIEDGEKIMINFESSSKRWRQGIILDVEGEFGSCGERFGEELILWEDTCPKSFTLTILTKSDYFRLKNVWLDENDLMQSWTGGAAMYSEDIPGGRRYFCNDGDLNDDFNDLVFTITQVEAAERKPHEKCYQATPENLARMNKGKPPQTFNTKKQVWENVQMHLCPQKKGEKFRVVRTVKFQDLRELHKPEQQE